MFNSWKDADEQRKAWKKDWPDARFTIEMISVDSKVKWVIVQTNRFKEE